MIRLDDVPPFLLGLELIVSKDGAAPGFRGSLAIGVEERARTTWWIAEADERMETRFQAIRPAAADCLMLFDADRAVLEAEGDRRVLDRFAARYGDGLSWLGAQSGRDPK